MNPKTGLFGLANKDFAYLKTNIILDPVYKEIRVFPGTGNKGFVYVLTKENGKKTFFYNKTIYDIEVDEILVSRNELLLKENGLYGMAGLDNQTGDYKIIYPKFKQIYYYSDYPKSEIKKAVLPDGTYYYISSKKGIEFYQPESK